MDYRIYRGLEKFWPCRIVQIEQVEKESLMRQIMKDRNVSHVCCTIIKRVKPN